MEGGNQEILETMVERRDGRSKSSRRDGLFFRLVFRGISLVIDFGWVQKLRTILSGLGFRILPKLDPTMFQRVL